MASANNALDPPERVYYYAPPSLFVVELDRSLRHEIRGLGNRGVEFTFFIQIPRGGQAHGALREPEGRRGARGHRRAGRSLDVVREFAAVDPKATFKFSCRSPITPCRISLNRAGR